MTAFETTSDAAEGLRELVCGLRAGGEDAVRQLFAEHGPGLVALARSIVGCEQRAQDVVQDAVVRALRSLGTLERPEALGAWLRRITTNVALQELRTRGRRRERSIETLLPVFRNDGHREGVRESWAGADRSPMEREETRRAVRDAVEALPDSYREIIMLRDLMGMDTAETSAVLGISQNLAKVRLHRARQALRSLLEEEFGS